MAWASIASLLARVAQSLYCSPHGQEARLQVYVDDPLLATKGTNSRRTLLTALFLACFVILGVKLAFPKAQRSTDVTWIGIDIKIRDWIVEAVVPQDKLDALLVIIDQMLSANVVPLKEVRS